MAKFEDQAGNFVGFGEVFQHILRGGDGFALAPAGRRGQARWVKSTSPSCLGELMLKRRPLSENICSPTRASSSAKRWERPSRTPRSMRTPACSMRRGPGKLQVHSVDALTPAFSTSIFNAGTSARITAASRQEWWRGLRVARGYIGERLRRVRGMSA